MPSSPGYKRNYAEEYKTEKARGELVGGAERKRARRLLLKKGLVKPGEDVDHKTPVSKGGTNALSNLREETPAVNRSFPRKPSGALVVNRPKTKK